MNEAAVQTDRQGRTGAGALVPVALTSLHEVGPPLAQFALDTFGHVPDMPADLPKESFGQL